MDSEPKGVPQSETKRTDEEVFLGVMDSVLRGAKTQLYIKGHG